MTIRTLDDIERDKKELDRQRFKENVSEDVKDMIGKIFPKKPEKKKPKKKNWVKISKLLGVLILLLILINLFLGNIWLLKFFLKDLLFGG